MRKKSWRIYIYAILIFVWTVAPIAWLFVSSISPHKELISREMGFFPKNPTLKNFTEIFNVKQSVGRRFVAALRNSFVVAGFVTLISLLFGTPAAYILARMKFRGRNGLIFGMLLARMLPSIALLIPFFVMIIYVSQVIPLYDTPWNLVIIYNSFILGFVVWIMKGYFETIPGELEEAAMVDGCSPFKSFFKIVLPLAIPGLVATGIFAFLLAWDEFLFALVFTRTENSVTLPMFIASLGSQYITDYEKISAAGFVAAIIPIAISMFFQKYIMKGLTAGSVKG